MVCGRVGYDLLSLNVEFVATLRQSSSYTSSTNGPFVLDDKKTKSYKLKYTIALRTLTALLSLQRSLFFNI